jgi:hypothetical protein
MTGPAGGTAHDAAYALLRLQVDALGARLTGRQYPDGMHYLELELPSGHVAMSIDWDQAGCVYHLIDALAPLLEAKNAKSPVRMT